MQLCPNGIYGQQEEFPVKGIRKVPKPLVFIGRLVWEAIQQLKQQEPCHNEEQDHHIPRPVTGQIEQKIEGKQL